MGLTLLNRYWRLDFNSNKIIFRDRRYTGHGLTANNRRFPTEAYDRLKDLLQNQGLVSSMKTLKGKVVATKQSYNTTLTLPKIISQHHAKPSELDAIFVCVRFSTSSSSAKGAENDRTYGFHRGNYVLQNMDTATATQLLARQREMSIRDGTELYRRVVSPNCVDRSSSTT